MRRVPLRRQLFLIAVAGILPLAVLAGAGLHLVFEQQREAEQRRALEVTRALATAVDTELKRSQSALEVLASTIVLDRGDFSSFHTMARRAVESQATWRGVTLADRSAQPLVDTAFPPGAALPPMFSTVSFDEVIETGKPRVGYVVKAGEGHILYLRAPVYRESELRYVISVLVDPEAILSIVQRQRVPADWVISVFDAHGSRVARSRAHEQYVGKKASQSLSELMERSGNEGTGLSKALEGDPVFTAFTRIPDSGWSVAIGVPTADVEGTALRSAAIYGSIVLLSILAGLVASLIVGRRVTLQMAKLRSAAQDLGAGRRAAAPQTDIHEIQELGEAINAAAKQRQEYEAEREDLLASEKAARLEAESANRAKDQFLAMLGHELRNPLAALSNAASVLEMGARDERASTRAREVIQRQVAHLSRLTDDLLDAASALLGKIELRVEPVNLATVAAQSLATLASTGRAAQHRVDTQLDEAWVRGDPVRLDQVVTNLLVNAVKYTPAGKGIVLRTRRVDGRCELVVSDEGVGMAPELCGRVFELFVQGDTSLALAKSGLGIGLALVRKLVRLHGGDVTASSEGIGKGAEFVVSLPISTVDGVSQPDEVGHPSIGGRIRVLVVDDQRDIADSIAMLIEHVGHESAAVYSGVAALKAARETRPDVMLIDVGMPGMTGYELAGQVREDGALAGVFLIALTGYGRAEDRARALASGFDLHLTKPLTETRLREALAGLTPHA